MRRMVISNGSDVASYLGVGTRGSVGRREGAVLDEVLASLLGSRVTRGHTLPVVGVDGMLANHEREGKTKSEDCWIFYLPAVLCSLQCGGGAERSVSFGIWLLSIGSNKN